MKDKKEHGVLFLSAICAILAVIVMAQAKEIEQKDSFVIKELCKMRGLEYKTSSYQVAKKVYRVECE